MLLRGSPGAEPVTLRKTGIRSRILIAQRSLVAPLRASAILHSKRLASVRPVTGDIASTRLEWADAYRSVTEAARDPSRSETLGRQLDVVTSELRKRVGGTFTLRELATEYVHSDAWVREAVAQTAAPGWPRTLSIVEGAAFHLYSRGAVDYAP